MKTYRCNWAPPEYEYDEQVVEAGFFVEGIGYDEGMQSDIAELEVGEVWTAPSMFDGHVVERLS